ncbi:receptor-type tyrosine-protein phosphatase V-like isoform X1 [Phyllopteryx taeniolatus]|uniref:receptor-type tyrosine-protein phosphatase V-like isoform X1 n=1 Tax=Phyllopteryx taeniolatus TaxID=161469 RepID=UPI002AD59AD6|nr:receptor-type tyrosine-protein phosphatase V-like isoform X1 [Phyllopteryx taeniolatus]XP_061635001.1 receptor-type tyrosine-protein phosphatase V-like isoform X1 [Phyllopteryx taeniolatus]
MRVQTFSKAQILREFESTCQTLSASDNRGFKQELEGLRDVGKDLSTEAADLEANKEKNRYPYILPYDHCRVRLSIQNSYPNSDYINANFVPGGGSERDFICTQGPMRDTIDDFWRMVWEQNVKIIVMVTSLRHRDLVLCDEYWSLQPGTVYHGPFQVTTMARKQGPDYFISTIQLRQRDCPTDRIITHYHYPSWPDRGVPKDPSSLSTFSDHVRQHLEAIPHLGPTVVHCSAGVGRSGTFVTLLWLMQLCVRGIRPDVRAAVADLRLHRMWMVQNLEQYIFVHQCLLYWLSGGKSSCFTHSDYMHRDLRRRNRHHRRKHPSDQPPSTLQQMLQPGKLLRRLLPS